jgi:hypothetical protein
MFIKANPYKVFQFSKTPVGLYARQKWLKQQNTQSWKIDFKKTVKKIQTGQLSDGSWGHSDILTIRHLFDLHLTIRKRNISIDRGLEWLINRCMKYFPKKKSLPNGK